jgi:hypothetical protein
LLVPASVWYLDEYLISTKIDFQNTRVGGWGCSSVVEDLTSMCETACALQFCKRKKKNIKKNKKRKI